MRVQVTEENVTKQSKSSFFEKSSKYKVKMMLNEQTPEIRGIFESTKHFEGIASEGYWEGDVPSIELRTMYKVDQEVECKVNYIQHTILRKYASKRQMWV